MPSPPETASKPKPRNRVLLPALLILFGINLFLLAELRRSETLVLSLHGVLPSPEALWDLDPSQFEALLNWIEASGREVIDLRDRVDLPAWDGAQRLALTFDDGRESHLTRVAPALLERAWPATFFLPSHPRARELSDEEILELARAGFQIGAHARTHVKPLGPGSIEPIFEDPETFQWEIHRPRLDLGEILNEAPTGFAYPFGQSGRAAQIEVEKAGYLEAYGLGGRLMHAGSPRFDLPRWLVLRPLDPLEIREALASKRPGRALRFGLGLALWLALLGLWIRTPGAPSPTVPETPPHAA